MIYFLDTNALYWYYGREKLNMLSTDTVNVVKLRQVLDETPNKALALSAFIEAIVRFRKKPDILHELLCFLKDKKIKIHNNVPYCEFDSNEYSYVATFDTLALTNYAQKILVQKIEVETLFVKVFLHIMEMLYLNHEVDANGLAGNDKLLEFIGKRNLSPDEEVIKKALSDGYLIDDEKRQLKKTYIKLLEEKCLFIDMLIRCVVKSSDTDADLVKEIKDVYTSFQQNKASNQNAIMTTITQKLSMDSAFIASAKTRISNMFSNQKMRNGSPLYIKEQSEYIEKVMFDAWIDRGKKIEKNDIFDMLFIGCFGYKEKPEHVLADSNTYLLSFDRTVKSMIRSFNNQNGNKIDSFYI